MDQEHVRRAAACGQAHRDHRRVIIVVSKVGEGTHRGVEKSSHEYNNDLT